MSAFELPPEHIQLLVLAAQDLGVDCIQKDRHSVECFALKTVEGRRRMFEILRSQNAERTGMSLAQPGLLDELDASRSPLQLPNLWVLQPKIIVQVLQWLRCYTYQSSQTDSWTESDAQAICSQLFDALLDLLAKHFNACWTVEPPSIKS